MLRVRMLTPYGLLLTLLAWLGSGAAAQAAERVALVIGNASYAERPLRNPRNDARAMAALLRQLGFTVTEQTDLDLRGFRAQVNAFLDRSRGAELRLFYYSGHGASYDGDNYLLPINHGVTRKYELPDQTYSLKTLLRGFRDQRGVNLVLLDSCRDAPFGDTKSIWNDSKGMKPIQPQEGVLIGYAAQNGRTASDNSGGSNSLYTKYLLRELSQALELREVLMRVRQAVYDESHGEQRPTTEDEVLSKVYLAESRPQAGQIFQDTLSDGTQGPAMVVIPSGEFWMGSPEGEAGRDKDERRHRVRIESAFALGQYEVTVGEFRRFVKATSYRTDVEKNAGDIDGCFITYWEGNEWKYGYRAGYSWKNPNFNQDDDHPVVCVSWNDAVAYADWLTQQTGQSYRLPSEAEWEYAARGGTTSARYWGEDPNQACRYANVADQTKSPAGSTWTTPHGCADGYWYPAPVGSFQPNGWKLHDLLGNVWEWTCSAYVKDYDGAEAKCISKYTTSSLVLRGGSWVNRSARVRSADRDGYGPMDRYDVVGFRLARSL